MKEAAGAILNKVVVFQEIVMELISMNSESVGRIRALTGVLERGGFAQGPLVARRPLGGVNTPEDTITVGERARVKDRAVEQETGPAPRWLATVLAGPRRAAAKSRVIEETAKVSAVRHEVKIMPAAGSTISSREGTRRVLQDTVDPGKSKICVKSVRGTRDNGIIVETASVADLAAFTQNE